LAKGVYEIGSWAAITALRIHVGQNEPSRYSPVPE
jgi:hypothetical protein